MSFANLALIRQHLINDTLSQCYLKIFIEILQFSHIVDIVAPRKMKVGVFALIGDVSDIAAEAEFGCYVLVLFEVIYVLFVE